MSQIDYVPPPTVAAFMESESFHNYIVGPVGSGKTTGSIMKIVYHAVRQRPSPHDGLRRTRWVIVRNTLQQLKDTSLKSWFEWFEDGKAGHWVSGANTFILRFGDVHAEIMFRPLDTPQDVRRVLSLELTGAMLDEFVEIPREIIESLAGRCGRYPSKKNGGPTWRGMWGASNPGNEDNWWHDWLDVEERGTRAKNMSFFTQPSGVSPEAENLDNLDGGVDYYHRQMEANSPEWINQFVKSQWGFSMRGKPVYQSFNMGLHVSDTPLMINSHSPVYIGFDAGLTPAAILAQEDPSGQVVVLREVTSDNMGARRFCREKLIPLLRRDFPGSEIIVEADPACTQRAQTDEKSVAKVLEEELGVRVHPAVSNTLAARLGAVDDMLNSLVQGRPAFLIDPSCIVLIRGFRSGYRYAVNQKGAMSPTPDKNLYSHPHDACQYLCMGFKTKLRRAAQRLAVARTVSNGYTYF